MTIGIPERTTAVSVDENVQVVLSSTREGYTETSELIGYDTLFHDRTGYTSVDENVGLTSAVSKREGHADVSMLLGYGSIFYDRTGYTSVDETITTRPFGTDVLRYQQGWGISLRGVQTVKVGKEDVATTVTENVGYGPPSTQARDALITVSESEVIPPIT